MMVFHKAEKMLWKKAGFNISTITVAQEQLINHIQTENIAVLLVRSATTVRKDLIDVP